MSRATTLPSLYHAGFDSGNHCMSLPCAGRIFFTGIDNFDRSLGLFCQKGAYYIGR
jgi:hypothetical protein